MHKIVDLAKTAVVPDNPHLQVRTFRELLDDLGTSWVPIVTALHNDIDASI